jgi:Family of unknown function (DUF6186)
MSSRDATITGFVVVALAVLVLLAASWSGQLARVGEVIDGLLARRATRVLVVFVWAWLGWHFLVRTG